jgi:AcrR family transcriptional regulator
MSATQEISFEGPKRRRNAVATRWAILRSALAAFARHGYDGIGTREIAEAAGVTAVLVNRYFGTKEKLFAEAVELAFATNGLFDGELTDLANRLTDVIMKRNETRSEPNDALLLMLNSAPNPRAAEILRSCIARQFERPLKSFLQGPRADERAAMILALVAGFILMRKVIGMRALSDVDGTLSIELEMMFQRLIDNAAGGGSSRRQDGAEKHGK